MFDGSFIAPIIFLPFLLLSTYIMLDSIHFFSYRNRLANKLGFKMNFEFFLRHIVLKKSATNDIRMRRDFSFFRFISKLNIIQKM